MQMLLEEMRSQFAAVLEVVTPMSHAVEKIADTQAHHGLRLDKIEGQISGLTAASREHSADLRELKSDMKDVKADLKEVKQIVGGHTEAITELQAASHSH